MTKNSETEAEAEISPARVFLFDKYACVIEGPVTIGGDVTYYVREQGGRLLWVGSASTIRAFVQGIAFEKRKQFEKLDAKWREQQAQLKRESENEAESAVEAEAAAGVLDRGGDTRKLLRESQKIIDTWMKEADRRITLASAHKS